MTDLLTATESRRSVGVTNPECALPIDHGQKSVVWVTPQGIGNKSARPIVNTHPYPTSGHWFSSLRGPGHKFWSTEDFFSCSPNGSHVAERLCETLMASGTDRSHEASTPCHSLPPFTSPKDFSAPIHNLLLRWLVPPQEIVKGYQSPMANTTPQNEWTDVNAQNLELTDRKSQNPRLRPAKYPIWSQTTPK